jgi:hypothetical protein
VHETVRSIPPGADIEFHVIKSFKEKGFRMSEKGGIRVQSVRRTNPLAAGDSRDPRDYEHPFTG